MNLYINEKNEQRKWDAQHLKKVDRVPVCFSDQLDFLHGWLGFDCQRYHFDPQVTLDAQIAFNKRFDGTGIIGPNWGVAIEPSAFGSKVIFPKDNPPWALEVCKDLDDLEDFVNNLEDPNPVSSGYIPAFLESYFYMQRVTDGQIGKAPGLFSSFDTASLLLGMETLCIAVKLEPELVHRLLAKINKFLIALAETKAEFMGVDHFGLVDIYGDNAGYLSREDFTEFITPYNKEIYDYFGSDDTVKFYHCDGTLGHLIDLIPDSGCNCLYSFDPTTDMSRFVEEIGDRVCLMGNIAPIDVLHDGTPEEVEEEARRIIEIGKKAKGFVLTTGGELASGIPPENIDAVLRAVDKYGKYEDESTR